MKTGTDIKIGVVGLGLMGSSIVTALLVAGHPVSAIAPVPSDLEGIRSRISNQLDHYKASEPCCGDLDGVIERLTISEDYQLLGECSLVIECVIEKPEVKREVYGKITDVVDHSTVIATNTSAIPISSLQEMVAIPQRFLGIHWAEPAYLTRFLEIICGSETDPMIAKEVVQLARTWGKEPTLLRKDIRGFITNRLMYSVYREIFSLIETGAASAEDADKAFRYDVGSWVTLMGIFRRLDYTGFGEYDFAIRNLLPTLSVSDHVPETMKAMLDAGANGIFNGHGLYAYEEGEAKRWEEAFAGFNREIYALAAEYSEENIQAYLRQKNEISMREAIQLPGA